jgi:hypothetical protein
VTALKRQSDPAEQRASKRRTLLLRLAAVLDGRPERIVRCTIKDISEGGARLRVGAQESIGDEVTLIDPTDGTERRVRVVWRRGQELGVEFIGPSRLGRPRSVEQP